MTIVTIMVAVIAAVLMLPAVSDSLCIVRSPGRRRTRRGSTELPRLLFLVPAHDEEPLIESCVRSLRTLRYPADRSTVVVIADNCTDRTAARARAAGALCLERHDPACPGKPRAIAWALTRVALDRHDTAIIIDADTVVDPGFGAAVARAAPLNHKVLQAYFDVANPRDSSLTRMAAVLAAANFRFAYPLKRRVGVNAPLLGNGMCIGGGVLATHGWKAFTIAEDWELYALYTAQGVSIETVEDARLFSQEAGTLRQSATQPQLFACCIVRKPAAQGGRDCKSYRQSGKRGPIHVTTINQRRRRARVICTNKPCQPCRQLFPVRIALDRLFGRDGVQSIDNRRKCATPRATLRARHTRRLRHLTAQILQYADAHPGRAYLLYDVDERERIAMRNAVGPLEHRETGEIG